MRNLTIDTYTHLDSPLHRLDPRAKLVALVLGVLTMASVPTGELSAFAGYYLLLAILVVCSRIPLREIVTRCLLASPFILVAVALLQISVSLDSSPLTSQAAVSPILLEVQIKSWRLGFSVLLKAYGAIIALTLLTGTSRFSQLIWALRQLKAPAVLNWIASLMFRYLFILMDEFQRTTRARESRTPGPLRMSLLKLYGNQLALVFVRSWERAERVHAAMVSRGLSDELPKCAGTPLSAADITFAGVFGVLFVGIRLAVY